MRTGFRIGAWIGGSLLVLLGACALLVFAFFHKFYPAPPTVHYPPAHDLVVAQRQDLDYFKHYFELNRSYSPASLAAAKAVWRDTEGKIGTLAQAQFDLAVMRMVALADAGHSQIYKPSLYATVNRIPCRFYRFADGWYVVRAGPSCNALLGGQLLTLDGQPAAILADKMYAYSLGPRNHYDQYVSPFYLESPDLLHAAGLTPTENGLTLVVRMRDGTLREASIAADPPNPQAVAAGSDWTDAYSDSYLAPERIAGEPADWTTLLPRDAQSPLFLRDYANPFHSAWWPGTHTLYVQFRSNEDEPGHPIRPFVAQVRHAIKTDRPRFIVLDLRLDQGGNFTTTAGLMKHITNLCASIEHVYVLTSAWTFSAGDISLALVKQHGGSKVTTIGEPVGDHLRIWAEGRGMQLPNSQLWVQYATGYEDYSKPCWSHRDCFWTMLFYPTRVQSFDPDVRVAYTSDDYLHNRDPLLAKAQELAAKVHSASAPEAAYSDSANHLHQL